MGDTFQFELGEQVTDKITGFTGIITGRAEYPHCRFAYLVEGGGKPGNDWLDENRLFAATETQL